MKKLSLVLFLIFTLVFSLLATSCEDIGSLIGGITSDTDTGGDGKDDTLGENENPGSDDKNDDPTGENKNDPEEDNKDPNEDNKDPGNNNGNSNLCYCGGGVYENGDQWSHAKCPECEKYVCEHDLCDICGDFYLCQQYCSLCKGHTVCQHPWYNCSHCGGYLWYCESPEWSGNIEHSTVCDICGLYMCERDNYHEECKIASKNCPGCGEEGMRSEHECGSCDGYVCDGNERHDVSCNHCGIPSCLAPELHDKLCDICGNPLCIGSHTSCEKGGNADGDDDNASKYGCTSCGGALEYTEYKEATCLESGYSGYYKCNACDEFYQINAEGICEKQSFDTDIFLPKTDCKDEDGDLTCDWCGKSEEFELYTCNKCGSTVKYEKYCTACNSCINCCMCNSGELYTCPGCGSDVSDSAELCSECGKCDSCCICSVVEDGGCPHSNCIDFAANCETNSSYSHFLCNDCQAVLYVVYNANGTKNFYACGECVIGGEDIYFNCNCGALILPSEQCAECGGCPKCCACVLVEDTVCTHPVDTLRETSPTEMCMSTAVHYYCELCDKIVIYDETSIYMYSVCSWCYGDYDITDEDKMNTCSQCYRISDSGLCDRCNKCDSCCECPSYDDATVYCPTCSANVSFSTGYDATCTMMGMHDTYYCSMCYYYYTVSDDGSVKHLGNDPSIMPYGHKDSDSDYACDRCGKLYTEGACVICGNEGSNPCYGEGLAHSCMEYYEHAVRPVTWYGVIKKDNGDGTWTKISVSCYKESGTGGITYSLLPEGATDYIDIINIECSIEFVSDYVVKYTPVSYSIYRKNIVDYKTDVYGAELSEFDTSAISYIMLTDIVPSYSDGVWAPNDNLAAAILNLPFKVCESCHGIGVGEHGICGEDDCGKDLCAGHVHGVCDHENVTQIYDQTCVSSMMDHGVCNDCGDILYGLYVDAYIGLAWFPCTECDMYSEGNGEDYAA